MFCISRSSFSCCSFNCSAIISGVNVDLISSIGCIIGWLTGTNPPSWNVKAGDSSVYAKICKIYFTIISVFNSCTRQIQEKSILSKPRKSNMFNCDGSNVGRRPKKFVKGSGIGVPVGA